MKREIKFRAWDNTFNVMLNDIVVWGSDSECIAILDQPAQWAYDDKLDDRMDLNFEGSVPEWYCFTGGFNIMQFTGLKDKNGVEIYESDFLKSPDEYFAYCLCEWNEIHSCFQINGYGKSMYFNEGGGEEFTNDVKLIEEHVLVLGGDNEIEVIGNIYQNADLLTSAKTI
jgi:uncharacterized phage protein (TIGR01671 family)